MLFSCFSCLFRIFSHSSTLKPYFPHMIAILSFLWWQFMSRMLAMYLLGKTWESPDHLPIFGTKMTHLRYSVCRFRGQRFIFSVTVLSQFVFSPLCENCCCKAKQCAKAHSTRIKNCSLASMPHLTLLILLAGTSGSWKSVWVSSYSVI